MSIAAAAQKPAPTYDWKPHVNESFESWVNRLAQHSARATNVDEFIAQIRAAREDGTSAGTTTIRQS